jgi:hypothetical protein
MKDGLVILRYLADNRFLKKQQLILNHIHSSLTFLNMTNKIENRFETETN